MSDYTPRQERGLRKITRQLACVTDSTPEAVQSQIDQAVASGLLRVTRNGSLQATVPDEAVEYAEANR